MTETGARKFGDEAEKLALKYLSDKGYQILEQGYRFNRKEIDIICKTGDTIVFVEVKAARTAKFGAPETWVTAAKQKNIITAAQGYIQEHDVGGCDFRFDVIGYRRIKNDVRLNHFEGAFCVEENP